MRLLSAASLVLLLCACGPGEPGDGDGGSSTDSTAANSSGAGSSPEPTDTTNTDVTTVEPTTGELPTTGPTPTTGDLLCADPTVPVGPAVEIEIHNTSGVRVFLDFELGCQQIQPFTLATGPGQPPLKLDLGFFEFTCSEAQGQASCGRDPGCPFGARVLQLDADASLKLPWSGGAFIEAELPAGCADQFCGGCWIEQQAAETLYTVSVAHSKKIIGCDGPCSECEANAEGWCITEGARAEQGNAGASFKYPGTSSVVVDII